MSETKIPTKDFIIWCRAWCPNLYMMWVNNIIAQQEPPLTKNEVFTLFDQLQDNGLWWCLNWELVSRNQFSLN